MSPSARARQGVFVSYARSDGEAVARALHERLAAEAPDIEAWLDRFEIEGGVGWWKQIDQELVRAEFLLMVMTPAGKAPGEFDAEQRRQRGVCVARIGAVRRRARLNTSCRADAAEGALRLEHEWPKLTASSAAVAATTPFGRCAAAAGSARRAPHLSGAR
jgi:hypothetical protein